MIPFNFHHLYYFFTVAETGSVSKAADQLHVSQPALSAQIKQLERYLKVKLFEREGKRLVLTAQGKSAQEYARAIFDTGREFIDNFQDRAHKGRLRIQIGVSNSVAKIFVSQLVRLIPQLSSTAYIVVHKDRPERLIEDLDNHALDLVLSDTPLIHLEGSMSSHLVAKIPIVFCAHPKLLNRKDTLLKALKRLPIILPGGQSAIFNGVQEYFASNHVDAHIFAEVQDIDIVHRMVEDGQGMAPLNRMAILQAPSRDPLVIPPQRPIHHLHDTIYLLTKRRQFPHPLVNSIIRNFKLM